MSDMSPQEANVRAALAAHVEGEELMQYLREAETKPDRVEYLESIYHKLVANKDGAATETEQNLFTHYRLSVEPAWGKQMDRKTMREVTVQVGWQIRREFDNDSTRFGGRTLAWRPLQADNPFASEHDARMAAVAWASSRWRVDNQPSMGVADQLCRIPYCPSVPKCKKQQVHWDMTAEETRKMQAILVAMQESKLYVEGTRPVVSYADVLRVLLTMMPNLE